MDTTEDEISEWPKDVAVRMSNGTIAHVMRPEPGGESVVRERNDVEKVLETGRYRLTLATGHEQVVSAASLELVQPEKGDRVLLLSNDSDHIGEIGEVVGKFNVSDISLFTSVFNRRG